ncbi:MAG: type II toxin-antitoxin system RelE/ParE family toxin [Planctomycetales bacterium]|nr:type II toxin-antitoxin system RelE/ParE family toxin [Planctomycetales bacterium]
MPGRIEYKASVERDLGNLDRQTAVRILAKIERGLVSGGAGGKPLSGEFTGLFALRAGDWRVVYPRADSGYLVLRIGHRRDVYRKGRP